MVLFVEQKVYFDSGEYNVVKSKERLNLKKVSQAPVTLPDGSSGEEEESDILPSMVPAPETQKPPTPEELILRRASLHMPKSKPLPEQLLMRRATIQAQRMLSTGQEANPLEILGELPALSPEHLSRKQTPSVPSKLAMDG